jgi:TolB-like protein
MDVKMAEDRVHSKRAPSPGAFARWGWLVAVGALVLFLMGAWSWGIARRIKASVDASHAIHSIAVLPLENLTGDPSQEYLADGMTEALITDLAQISALRVISRTSVMHYKRTREPLPDIARELGVDGIVEGSVVRTGSRVRIRSHLILASSDQPVWARSYDREMSDVVALQSEVAHAIAAGVRAAIRPE